MAAETINESISLIRVCVFCGSSPGANPAYLRDAELLGKLLANEGITLVYGGGRVGVMGAIADSVLAAGGKVIGVIPEGLLVKEVAHAGLSELHVVGTMHERKAMMADLSDAFLALPGGFGTFDELFEIMTWAQLGIHTKPIGLLNTAGYFDSLIRMIDCAVREGFVRKEHRDLLIIESDVKRLVGAVKRYGRIPQMVEKWLDRGEI